MPLRYETTIINPTAEAQYYSWAPPHGRTMQPAEEYTQPGDIEDWLKAGGTPLHSLRISYEYAVDNALVEVKSGPSQVLYDPTLDESKKVTLVNGVLGAAAP